MARTTSPLVVVQSCDLAPRSALARATAPAHVPAMSATALLTVFITGLFAGVVLALGIVFVMRRDRQGTSDAAAAHVDALSRKAHWEQLGPGTTPGFVVLLATPTTLIAPLRAEPGLH